MISGDVNANKQELVKKTNMRSTTHPYAKIWLMHCQTCGKDYGSNSCDAHIRLCPYCCKDAARPEPTPEKDIDVRILTREAVLAVLRENLPILRQEYGLKDLKMFGSMARDSAGRKSDVDLIADFRKPIGLRFVDFVERLENLLNAKVDVLTPTGVDKIRNSRIAKAIKESAINV